LKLSPQAIKSLYNILEVTFDPLTLCASIAPLLQTLATDEAYAPYLTLLQRALLSRLLSQLSQVYATLKISTLLALVAPLKEAGLEGAFDAEQVEAYIMGCARRGELAVRVDHQDGSIAFVDDAFSAADDPPASSTAATASARTPEAAVQPSTAELVRTRLSTVARSLHGALGAIGAQEAVQVPSKEEQAARFAALVAAVEGERKALQLRRALVARRRELLSELSVRKEKEESSRRAEHSRREKEEEARRMKEELRRKEQERTKKEIETIRIDEAKKYAQSLVDKGILKPNDVEVRPPFPPFPV
jgi:translation initiation factor 3 subunit A